MANREADDRRPSPDALIEAAAREQRSRFRLFVGAAPGVGKTYAMLQAAQARRAEGGEVVIGVVETHGRTDTEQLLEGLEVIPRKAVAYRGQTLTEMDLDALLERRPAVALVDELAHTNAPGSRHPKRYLDVEELLDAGIEVWSTVNIQHLESLNDVVAQITGVRVRETVPDSILDRADEVRLIDLSPEELLQRLRDGKVYVPEQAERALEHFFRPEQLTALRELALRETAEHVDEQMQAHRRAQAAPGVWAVTERLVVAIDGGPGSDALLRAARRISERRDVPWIAVFVELPGFARASEPARAEVARLLRLAEELGGEAVTLPGTRVAEDLLRYARERNASEIVLGKPRRRGWFSWLGPSPVAEVIRGSGPIEVRVVESVDAEAPARAAARAPTPPPVLGFVLAIALVAAAGFTAAAMMAVLPFSDPGMIFLVSVLFTAVYAGLWPSIGASVLSVLVYDFFFVEPVYTFTIARTQHFVEIVVFLLVAILTSQLTARAREQADAARRREALTAALYDFVRDVAGAPDVATLLRSIAEHVAHAFSSRVVLLLPEGDQLRTRASHPPGAALAAADRATAQWAYSHREPAGHGTDTLPGSEWLHVPLATVRGCVGVLALHRDRPDAFLPLEQRQLIQALANNAAVAIERTRIDAVLAEKAKTEAVIESIDDGLVVLDPSGGVVHMNEIACAILDLERGEAIGRPFRELGTTHPHYLRLRAAVADFLAHPDRVPEAVEIAMFLRGRDHFFVLRPTPLRAANGTSMGLILTLQDVTYLRDQEARREQLMATLSHELRTPLTSLRMAADLLAQSDLPHGSEAVSLVQAAREDVARLEDVAQRLLELSRSRAMTIGLAREKISLRDLVERNARIFLLQAREAGVTLETDLAVDVPKITGDATKLGWALSNLIGNALRYTPRGGTIRIALGTAGDAVRLSVQDSGPGIPPEQRDRIFERFAQGEDPGAAGLGLSIVRDVVQAHGGRIYLESEVGRGSRFTIEIPCT
ncbi:MAG TPA: ATP-binding protein [Myxococcota bacterium]|nr:ATP-binding protein [Myxococcota bacterium]